MQDGYRIFGNGKSSKTTNKNQHHKFPSGLGFPKPEGKDEGESYTLFRTLPVSVWRRVDLRGETSRVARNRAKKTRHLKDEAASGVWLRAGFGVVAEQSVRDLAQRADG